MSDMHSGVDTAQTDRIIAAIKAMSVQLDRIIAKLDGLLEAVEQ